MIPPSVRIFACTEPVDMRRSFDGLAFVAQDRLGHDPLGGALFVFVNRRANRLKVLWFDKNGYCILYKRLHRAVFRLPARGSDGRAGVQINAAEFGRILEGVPSSARSRRFRPN